jgi:hypothetical protein
MKVSSIIKVDAVYLPEQFVYENAARVELSGEMRVEHRISMCMIS